MHLRMSNDVDAVDEDGFLDLNDILDGLGILHVMYSRLYCVISSFKCISDNRNACACISIIQY